MARQCLPLQNSLLGSLIMLQLRYCLCLDHKGSGHPQWPDPWWSIHRQYRSQGIIVEARRDCRKGRHYLASTLPSPLSSFCIYLKTSFPCLVLRFADMKCSGKASCQLPVYNIVQSGFHPFPPYYRHTLTQDSYVNMVPNTASLFSFADQKCSGHNSCKMRVAELVYLAKPCPLELATFLSAGHQCFTGKTSRIILKLF